MKSRNWLFYLIFAVLTAAYSIQAAPGLSPKTVKQLYKDGDFEKVRTQLEAFLKRSDATATHEERVLAYKYLGVVYASKPDGAPQAEAYFFRLFDLAPKVQITELYVSSSVNDLFQKTRERFLNEKQTSSSVDEFGNSIDDKSPGQGDQGDAMLRAAGKKPGTDTVVRTKEPIRNTPRQSAISEKKGLTIWPWVLGAVVVGGGIGLYVMSSEEPEAKTDKLSAGSN